MGNPAVGSGKAGRGSRGEEKVGARSGFSLGTILVGKKIFVKATDREACGLANRKGPGPFPGGVPLIN